MSSSAGPSARFSPGSLFFILIIGLIVRPGAGRAQDTTAVARDTVAAQDSVEATDTLPPPPMLPELAFPFAERRAAGVWHWDRAALDATAAVTVLDLLGEIPGVSTFRSGLFLQPEAASAYGGTSARVEVDLDGYVLDPLDASAIDLSTIELSSLSEVLIERRLDLLRIRLRSAAASDARPYSRIEAATGEPDANLFRGIFLSPNLWGIGPFGVAIQRLDTDGARSSQPADVFDAWLKWGWQTEKRGIQLEMRQSTLDREPPTTWAQTRRRRDLMLRVRNRFGESVTAEAYVGRASVDNEPPEGAEDAPGVPSPVERSGVQGGVRTSVALPNGWLEASLRARDEPSLPRLQTDFGAGFALGSIAAVRGDLSHQSWRGADPTLSFSARADAGPIHGVVPFLEWTTGERGAPFYADPEVTAPLIDNRTAFRVGAEATVPWVTLGGAFLRAEVDSVPAFGLPFERERRSYAGGSVEGFEAYGRTRLFFDWLAAEGSYQRWLSGQRWAYLPVEEGRAALTMDWTPMPSGNLQLIGWLEARRRGNVLTPDPGDNGLTLATLPARTIYNAYLQIRILSLRIFARYENLSGQAAEDFLGQPVPGPRLFYGVKWSFWN